MSDSSASPASVLVVGESLIDAVERGSEPPELHVGGSPANVAFGLGALDHDVSLATWFGRDDWGRRIADRCAEKGAKVVAGSDGAVRTSVARAVLDAGGAATYDFDITWQVPAIADLAGYGHVHTGSIAAVLEPGGSQTLVTVQQARATATVSYDPNARPSLMGSADEVRPRMEAFIALADVVKASDEDIAWLYPDRFVPDVLRHWGTLGASLTVVTRGGEGALYALNHVRLGGHLRGAQHRTGRHGRCRRLVHGRAAVGAAGRRAAGHGGGARPARDGRPRRRASRGRAGGHDRRHHRVQCRRLQPGALRARLKTLTTQRYAASRPGTRHTCW